MIVYPAIDLMDGKCVRLFKGDFEQKTIYDDSPEIVALKFYQEGAQWLHLIDLDGAKDPSSRQVEIIHKIIRSSNLQVQTGGGIRNEEDIVQLLDAGVSRVIVGSLSVKKPEIVKEFFAKFGSEKICIAADIFFVEDAYHVAVEGWKNKSKISLQALINNFLPHGLKHILCTDISRDGTLTGSNHELYDLIQRDFPDIELQASGGVASLDDLKRLNTAGVIIGKALYEGTFTYGQALETICLRNE